MYLHHQKSVWNLAIMKCCSLYRNWSDYVTIPKVQGELIKHARETWYPNNKALYLRALYTDTTPTTNSFTLYNWNLGIDGNPFPDAAVNILFKDDTPGHIIRPEALFNRHYVFQQFHIKKPDLSYGHELSYHTDGMFADSDDWDFTGGLFPGLTTK